LAGTALYAGPFQSRRAAQAFLDPALDLFRIRRCQIKIRRDPAFPGCIYSEMKMCLAPCFAGCTPEEYASEAARVAAFLSSAGASLSQKLSRDREQASAALDFERAATLHRRLEKVDAVLRNAPELIRRIEDLNAVILQLAAAQNTIAFFIVRAGLIEDPFLIDFADSVSRDRSPEQILRERFEQSSQEPRAEQSPAGNATELEDNLSLLARWFYAHPRAGEIFFQQPQPTGWPYRKILRACSRLLDPPASAPQT
jgi:excinuclease ABC subunit C